MGRESEQNPETVRMQLICMKMNRDKSNKPYDFMLWYHHKTVEQERIDKWSIIKKIGDIQCKGYQVLIILMLPL